MIGSDTTFRDEWLEGAARAFFVCSYASYIEEAESTDNDLTHDERMARLALDRPRPGKTKSRDWMDFAPETPIAAYALAGELWARIEHESGTNMYVLANRAALADHPCKSCKGSSVVTVSKDGDAYNSDCTACDGRGYSKEIDANQFGHYLAMQAMGHGVSWFDDHKRFVIRIPLMECYEGTFAEETYKGGGS